MIVLLSDRFHLGKVHDDELLCDALRKIGARVRLEAWDEWAPLQGEHGVVRSTWDYDIRLEEFMSWLSRVAKCSTISNSPELIKWNINKNYIFDLYAKGVPVLETEIFDKFNEQQMQGIDLVIKPAIGCSGHGVRYFHASEHIDMFKYCIELQKSGQVLLQRFHPYVLTHGEASLTFLRGQFSHAVLKIPRKGSILANPSAGAVIMRYKPSAKETEIAQAALDFLPQCPLYARVDILSGAAGAKVVISELELIEPLLFLEFAPDSASRFAKAIVEN